MAQVNVDPTNTPDENSLVYGAPVFFNEKATFFNGVDGIDFVDPFRIINGNSNVTVSTANTITVTTNSVGIVTFTQNNIGIANTVTLERTGIVQQLFENVNLSSTALTGTIDLDILSGTLFYYTANAGADWTFNVRGNASTSLNAILPVGKSVTVTVLSTQSTARLASTFKVDGSTISPKWQGGTAPSSGFASAVNTYVYTIIKTADATFTVFASITKFS
jgi:hypothetical protein